jgi:hypothetical protein
MSRNVSNLFFFLLFLVSFALYCSIILFFSMKCIYFFVFSACVLVLSSFLILYVSFYGILCVRELLLMVLVSVCVWYCSAKCFSNVFFNWKCIKMMFVKIFLFLN